MVMTTLYRRRRQTDSYLVFIAVVQRHFYIFVLFFTEIPYADGINCVTNRQKLITQQQQQQQTTHDDIANSAPAEIEI